MKRKGFIRMFAALLLVMTVLCAWTGCGEGKTAPSLCDALDQTAAQILETTQAPAYGAVHGEWAVLGLARWEGEVPPEWFDSYYEQLETYVQSCHGVLHEKKYTEYSRVVLALTAIGKDPSNVAGYNLLTPLADFEQTVFQGINGPVFALLALDSGNYEIPDNAVGTTQATRALYVDDILSKELSTGGWSFAGGEAEVDITAMVLQALAKYRDRQEVADAVERGLTLLSEQQNKHGGYTAYDAESSETIAQVIVALTELGISVEDPRFVKNGNTLLDRLLDFQAEDHGFKHLPDSESDALATEQAFYALVALNRAEQGKPSLYSMAQAG